jgi:hypothetical protein
MRWRQGKGVDAKGAKVATFRHVKTSNGKEEADFQWE